METSRNNMAAVLVLLLLRAVDSNLNGDSGEVSVTHIVSKETAELDRAVDGSEQMDKATLSSSVTPNKPETRSFASQSLSGTEPTARSSVSLSTEPPSLPPPSTEVSDVCECNVQREQCDLNCCCDPECTQELNLFTDCSLQKVSSNDKLCSRDTAVHSLTPTSDGSSLVRTSVQRENNPDILCIYSANYDEAMSFSAPPVPSGMNFDSLFYRFVGFSFGALRDGDSATPGPVQGKLQGYKFGDPIQTMDGPGQRGVFRFPTSSSSSSATCLDLNPAAFLKDQSSRCVRSWTQVPDCSLLQELNLRTYTGFQVLAWKNNETELVSVSVVDVTLQSLDGSMTLLKINSAASDLEVVALPADICNHVVLRVKYTVGFGVAGQIVRVLASFLLAAVDKTTPMIQQEFQISFEQDTQNGLMLRFSGNPGYVVGLPLVAGWRTPQGMVRSWNADGALTVLSSSINQHCLSDTPLRTPVVFGTDMVSGCTFRLQEAVNCSLISEVILRRLKGPGFPEYVASFGNSRPENPYDWVPIENQTILEGIQGCSVPVSYHLQVQWTKYGTLINPQAQIVSIMEIIQYNSSALSSVFTVMSSVSFTDVSDAASPGFRAPPTIDAKLPYNFYFPFA